MTKLSGTTPSIIIMDEIAPGETLVTVNGDLPELAALEAPQDWYFTFGMAHAHPNGYVKIHGTYSSAREEIMKRYWAKWAFQYTAEEFKGQIELFGLYEVTE